MFDELRDLYQATILDHGRHPRHMRRLDAFDATARGDNPMCGDRVQVWVRRGPEGQIANIGFEARGCAISIASADLMAESVAGLTKAEARTLFDGFRELACTGGSRTGACPDCVPAGLDRLRALSGVHDYPSRVKCATLPWHALLAALDGGKEPSHG